MALRAVDWIRAGCVVLGLGRLAALLGGNLTMTLYALKPQFQAMLRPLAARLVACGVSANAVTLLTASASVALGLVLCAFADTTILFLLLPAWLVLRVALNAIDGIMAREWGQQTQVGTYLNEIGDVVSDVALILPFAHVAPFSLVSIGVVILLAILSEFVGVVGALVGGARQYAGPMGKSDRALLFGALGVWVGIGGQLPNWSLAVVVAVSALLVVTALNRVRAGLKAE